MSRIQLGDSRLQALFRIEPFHLLDSFSPLLCELFAPLSRPVISCICLSVASASTERHCRAAENDLTRGRAARADVVSLFRSVLILRYFALHCSLPDDQDVRHSKSGEYMSKRSRKFQLLQAEKPDFVDKLLGRSKRCSNFMSFSCA